MVVFNEISDVNRKRFAEAISIYLASMPPGERQSVDLIRERVATKKERLFVGRSDNEVVFMALLWQGSDYILFDYMAVKSAWRNRGIGTGFMERILTLSGVGTRLLILEVDDPQCGDDKEIRERRVAFYKRNGAKEMRGVKFMLPPLQGDTPAQMIIMVLSRRNRSVLLGRQVKRLFTRIYYEVYGRGKDDPLLNSFINEIPQRVELV